METFAHVEPNFISGKVDFSCIDDNDSFYVYMNMLEVDRIIELAEIGKKILYNQEENYDYDDQLGHIHIDKEEAKVKSYAGKFEESTLKTKNFVKLLMKALLYYELIDNPTEFKGEKYKDYSMLDAIKNETERRLAPDVEISKLKKGSSE